MVLRDSEDLEKKENNLDAQIGELQRLGIDLDPNYSYKGEELQQILDDWRAYGWRFLTFNFPEASDLGLPQAAAAALYPFLLDAGSPQVVARLSVCTASFPLLGGHLIAESKRVPNPLCTVPYVFVLMRQLPAPYFAVEAIFRGRRVTSGTPRTLDGHDLITAANQVPLSLAPQPEVTGEPHLYSSLVLVEPFLAALTGCGLRKLWRSLWVAIWSFERMCGKAEGGDYLDGQVRSMLVWLGNLIPVLPKPGAPLDLEAPSFIRLMDRFDLLDGRGRPRFTLRQWFDLLTMLDAALAERGNAFASAPEWFYCSPILTATNVEKLGERFDDPGESAPFGTVRLYGREGHLFDPWTRAPYALPNFAIDEQWGEKTGAELYRDINSGAADKYSVAAYNALIRTVFRGLVLTVNSLPYTEQEWAEAIFTLLDQGPLPDGRPTLRPRPVPQPKPAFVPYASWQSILHPACRLVGEARDVLLNLRRTQYSSQAAVEEFWQLVALSRCPVANPAPCFVAFRPSTSLPPGTGKRLFPLCDRGPKFQLDPLLFLPAGYYHRTEQVHRFSDLETEDCLVKVLHSQSALGLLMAEVDYLEQELALPPEAWRSSIFYAFQLTILKTFSVDWGLTPRSLASPAAAVLAGNLPAEINPAWLNLARVALLTDSPGFRFSPSLWGGFFTDREHAMLLEFLRAVVDRYQQGANFGLQLQRDAIKFSAENLLRVSFLRSMEEIGPGKLCPSEERALELVRFDDLLAVVEASPLGFPIEGFETQYLEDEQIDLAWEKDKTPPPEDSGYQVGPYGLLDFRGYSPSYYTTHKLTFSYKDFTENLYFRLVWDIQTVCNLIHDVSSIYYPALPDIELEVLAATRAGETNSASGA